MRNMPNALPPVPSSGESQPVLTTETYGAISDSVKMDHGNSGNREGTAVNPDMPTGGTIPDSSTDIEDPTAHP
jgi:hypothetical protein